MVKVSVIVPIYNCEKYLDRCMNSILNQTYDQFELILINDGSTDNSLNILKKYKRMDNRIIIIDNKNNGVSKTRNIGIDISKGEYISFIDADDFIDGDMLEDMVTLIEDECADIVMTGIILDIELNNKVNTKIQSFDEDVVIGKKEIAVNVLKRLNGTYINSPVNKLYKKEIIINNNIYMNENIDLGEDLIFNLNYLSNCKKAIFKEKAYYHYCIRVKESLTANYRKDKLENMEFIYNKCKEYFLECGLNQNYIEELNSNFIKWLFYCYIDLYKENCSLNFSQKYKYIKSSKKKYKEIISNSRNKSLIIKILKITLNSTFSVMIISKSIYFIKNNMRYIIYR